MKPYIILTLLVALAYANSLQNSFVWDDDILIVDNPSINAPLREIPSIFLTPMWKWAGFSEGGDGYYRPIVSLFLILNYKTWGLNPLGFHLTNILLHLVSTIILYRVGLLLFNNDVLVPLIGASIFIIHPVHNEPVGRAASGEVIFGFFIIFSIYLFLKEKKRYLSYLTFFFALLSKESSVMLPFALLILSTNKKGIKKGIIEIIPYIILVCTYLFIRTMVSDIVLGINMQKSSISAQILTMIAASFDYVRLLIIPYPLSPFYPARWHASIFEPKVIFAIIVLISLLLLAIKIRKNKVMLFMLLFPFIMLSSVIWRVNAFMVGIEQMYIAERFLYVPAMLFSIFISAYTVKVFKDRANAYLITSWALFIIIFIIITISSNKTWKDNITLFGKIIKESPNATFAYNNLGYEYDKKGQYDKAIEEYDKAIALNPNYIKAYNNRGATYYKISQYDRAIEDYNRTIALDPNYPEAYNNRGAAYAIKGQHEGAISDFQRACDMGLEGGCKNLQTLQKR